MFTGIIESIGVVKAINHDKSNINFCISSDLISELKVDQSISHNGVCLTVVNLEKDSYTVTAIKETLDKTNLGKLKLGDQLNLERCLKVGDRLDGHFVQGHVDQIATCVNVDNENELKITEDDLFDRERIAFIKLAKTKLTFDRISALLEKGISLRN